MSNHLRTPDPPIPPASVGRQRPHADRAAFDDNPAGVRPVRTAPSQSRAHRAPPRVASSSSAAIRDYRRRARRQRRGGRRARGAVRSLKRATNSVRRRRGGHPAGDRAGMLFDYDPASRAARFDESNSSQARWYRPHRRARTPISRAEAPHLVFGIGPAGTGKTCLAVALAIQMLAAPEVDRIILSRPAVEAGERLGFLPGDMARRSTRICARSTMRSTT